MSIVWWVGPNYCLVTYKGRTPRETRMNNFVRGRTGVDKELRTKTIKTIKRDKSRGYKSSLTRQGSEADWKFKDHPTPSSLYSSLSQFVSPLQSLPIFSSCRRLFLFVSVSLGQVSWEEKENKRKNSQKSVSYGPTHGYNSMVQYTE